MRYQAYRYYDRGLIFNVEKLLSVFGYKPRVVNKEYKYWAIAPKCRKDSTHELIPWALGDECPVCSNRLTEDAALKNTIEESYSERTKSPIPPRDFSDYSSES